MSRNTWKLTTLAPNTIKFLIFIAAWNRTGSGLSSNTVSLAASNPVRTASPCDKTTKYSVQQDPVTNNQIIQYNKPL